MNQWLWGLRHTTAFIHPLDQLLGNDEVAGPLVSPLSIKPENLPVAENLASDDPRKALPGYPRPGDSFNVDAAHPGFGPIDTWGYGGGPAQRFIVRLHPDEGVSSVNMLPGGQAADSRSPHWADQARLWLGNETMPMWFEAADVAEHGQKRWVAVPRPGTAPR